MTALASRVAGTRLLAIIAVLLVPILVLSYLTISHQRMAIASAEEKVTGVTVAGVVMDTILGLSAGTLDQETAAKRLEGAVPGLKAIHAEKYMAALLALYADRQTPRQELLQETLELLEETGVHSGLTLDENPESNFLSEASVMQLPALVVQFHDFQSGLENAVETAGIDHSEFKHLMIKVGNLSEALGWSADAIDHAKDSSADPGIYDSAESLVQSMKHDTDITIDVISSARAGTEPFALSMLARQNINPAAKYKMAAQVWNETSGRLKMLLTQRLSTLKQQLYVLLAVAALCVLVALGGAMLLFSRTLKKLDLLETERIRADEARKEAETARAEAEQVNAEVAALNRNLADKIQRLKEAQDEIVKKGRMEQMGQLTATIAHELRNPLGAVRTSAFLIERKVKSLDLGLEAQLQRINNGITRCDNIITQLLDYSRNKPLQCNAANLDEWLSKVVSEEAQRLPQTVMIELALGLDDRMVPFDSSRLQRAVINLINNAVEALTTGGPEGIARHAADCKLWISTRIENGENVVIQVKDNGPGIAPENLQKIREPLFTTKSFGTGLGIPAIEQIARQHGGRLEIESRIGDGACFEIYLPLRPAQEQHAA